MKIKHDGIEGEDVDSIQVAVAEGISEDTLIKEKFMMLKINNKAFIFGQDELKRLQETDFTKKLQQAIDTAFIVYN